MKAEELSTQPKGLQLKRVLLTNWLYYDHLVLEFGEVTGFQGDTGSGKSAICDAMLLCMTSDTKGRYFNKAANSEGRRTLESYLRGKTKGTEEEKNSYIRSGSFTTHIALEFHDAQRHKDLTQLTAIDTVNDAKDKVRFFTYDGKIPENEFIVEDIPMNTKTLQKYLKSWSGASRIADNTTIAAAYKESGNRFGAIGDYAPLLYKAAAFDPAINYDQFFREYVCKPGQSVDVQNLVVRYQSLLRLRNQAKVTALQVRELEAIEEENRTQKRAVWNIHVHDYMEKLLLEANAEQAVQKQKQEILHTDSTVQKLEAEGDELTGQIHICQKQAGLLQARLHADASKRQVQTLEEEIRQLEARAKEWQEEWNRQRSMYEAARNDLDEAIAVFQDTEKVLPESTRSGLQDTFANLGQLCQQTAESAPEQVLKTMEYLAGLETAVQSTTDLVFQATVRLEDRRQDLEHQLAQKEKELAEARDGIVRFPRQTEELKRRLEAHFANRGKDAHVVIVGAETQILNDKWRNAIEGYLNNQKKDLLVDEDCFEEVEAVMKQYRQELRNDNIPLKARVVDVRKVREKMAGKKVQPQTLANEVTSEDKRVDLYVKWLLNNVFECETVAEMRRHDIAVKADGLLYRGAAMGSMDHRAWTHPLIGSKAAALRVAALEKERQLLLETLVPYQKGLLHLSRIRNLLDGFRMVRTDQLADSAKNAAAVPGLFSQIRVKREEIRRIDTSTYEMMELELADLNKKILFLEKQKEDCSISLGKARQKRVQETVFLDQKEQSLQTARQEKAEQAALFPDVVEEGQKRFCAALEKKDSSQAMQNSFRSTKERNRQKAQSSQARLENLMDRFNDTHHLGLRMLEDVDEFALKLDELKRSGLPESQEKLSEYEKDTKDEFKQGVLDKIRDDIESSRRQIRTLNQFLGRSAFQGRTYSIVQSAHPGKARLYHAIMDRECMEKDPEHWEQAIREKHGDVLDLLYDELFSSDGFRDAEVVESLYCDLLDYRNYIKVDMQERSQDADGTIRTASLSRDSSGFSGGEGQLPFYLVILASAMMQYRIGVDAAENTIRVIFFDEAFSKMSDNLIPQSIQMARSMGLQPVIFMPNLDPEMLPETEYLYYVAKTATGQQPDILPFAELREYMEPYEV